MWLKTESPECGAAVNDKAFRFCETWKALSFLWYTESGYFTTNPAGRFQRTGAGGSGFI
jgi:hypothetical protein